MSEPDNLPDDLPEPHHPQRTITHGDRTADVDEDIADLILELWKADIPTMMSCQDNDGGRVWIMFTDTISAERFLNLVGTFDLDVDSIYNAIAHDTEPDDWETYRAERAWKFDPDPRDFGTDWPEDPDDPVIETGPRDFVFAMSVRFPRADYPTVLARMKATNIDPPAEAGSAYGRALMELGRRHPDELTAIEAEVGEACGDATD